MMLEYKDPKTGKAVILATEENLKTFDGMKQDIIVAEVLRVETEGQEVKETLFETKIIITRSAEDQALKKLEQDVLELRETIDLKEKDVVVIDKNGVPTPTVITLSAKEKTARSKVTEPKGATQEEIDAMDTGTHKLVYTRAGFADGSIGEIVEIVPLD